MLYEEYILNHIPDVLTQMDRDIHSKTYGSFDRGYWHLKLHDFSSAILQQSALTLALVYTTDFEGNMYFDEPSIREWAIAGLRYMGQIQLSDGSFNEYYPNEHGFPPTAFNLFAGCYTYAILDLDDAEIRAILSKSAIWLCHNEEYSAYNQEVAALAGLMLYYSLFKDDRVIQAVNNKINVLTAAYCEEGWFPEQGGVDIGYLSVALDMLSEYCAVDDNPWASEKIIRIIDFISCFVHPDGTTGGEYCSRNTTYFMPAGFENAIRMGLDNRGTAERILRRVYYNKQMGCDHMLAVDERYNTHYVLHSYLRALRYRIDNCGMDRSISDEGPFWGTRVYDKAGLAVISRPDRYMVISAVKGGVIKVYINGREVLCDCGYRIPIDQGITAATNWIGSGTSYRMSESVIESEGCFYRVKQKVQTPLYMLGLRALGVILGKKLNTLIKGFTINQKSSFNAGFYRMIKIADDSIVIDDRIDNPDGFRILESSNISLRLVASGKFFSKTDLLRHKYDDYGNAVHMHRVRNVDLADGSITTEVDYGTK